jgi:hypothetical protein
MTTLYSIHLGRHIKRFGKPCVRAEPAGLIGHLRNGQLVRPDGAAIRVALPHYYRKAFERSNGMFRYVSEVAGDDGNTRKSAYCTLYSSRGRYLNTIYAIPFEYKPTQEAAAS